jgi:hypothetical protein
MLMFIVWSCSLLLGFLFQAGQVPTFPDDLFIEKEKKKIEKNRDDLNERLEVYKDASMRIQKSLQKNLASGKYDLAFRQMDTWLSLLSGSIEDIEANTNPKKKKSKDLIRYEIQVRRSIGELQDYKIRVPVKEQDALERAIERADAIRVKMVDVLFQPEKLSSEGADK